MSVYGREREREREKKRKTDYHNFQSGTKGDTFSPKIWRQCLIDGSTLSVNNFGTNTFLKHDNDYFEPESVTASYWNSGNDIPWPTDQWKFWGNQQGTQSQKERPDKPSHQGKFWGHQQGTQSQKEWPDRPSRQWKFQGHQQGTQSHKDWPNRPSHNVSVLLHLLKGGRLQNRNKTHADNDYCMRNNNGNGFQL